MYVRTSQACLQVEGMGVLGVKSRIRAQVKRVFAIGIATTLLLTACTSASPAETPSPGGTSSQVTPTAAAKQTTPQATSASLESTPQSAATTAATPQVTSTAGATPQATATSAVTPASATTPAAASPTPAQSAGGSEIGAGDVQKMTEAWADVKSFRMKFVVELEGQTSEGVIEVVRPDRERFTSTVNGQEFELIRIGEDTYLKMGGEWIKSTGVPSGLALGTDPDELMNEFDASANLGNKVTKGGTSTVEGTPCQEWIVTSADAETSGTICVGLADNLPRQYKSADGKATITFTDWNAPITIDPPQE